MFEYGIITFDEDSGYLQMDIENLNDSQKQYIEEITPKMNISKQHLTEELKGYLKIHNDRIKKVIGKYNYCNVNDYSCANQDVQINVADGEEDYTTHSVKKEETLID